MAEAVLAVLLDQLSWLLRNQVNHRFSLVNALHSQISTLKLNLQAIHAVLNDAEKRQLTDNAVGRWLDELKDASNDVDDVLDELNYSPNDKVFRLFRWFRYSQLGLKIRELNVKFEEISVRKDRYNLSVGREVLEPKTETCSIVDVSEVYGRDFERESLVAKLCLCEIEATDVEIVPILGLGGIGKTTLAQLVYNDDRVKARFETRVWVCVSDPFDPFKIARAIVEQISGEAPNVTDMECLMGNVVESIRGKRFLLVLDDVWTEDYTKWESLKRALKYGHFESKVLVTTRKEEVAVMMRGLGGSVRLETLSDEDSWSLFRQVAFSGRDEDDAGELEEIGKEIARKCRGLPLGAKTLGSHMRFKKTREQWKVVLNSEMWELEEAKRNLFSPLLLSYYDLSPTAQRCFSYCAVFAKDNLINRDDLVQQWMSQGYFSSNGSTEIEVFGEECFDSLATRCFFQDFVKDWDGTITACKMHDIVHDFAKFLTVNECSTIEVERDQDPPDGAIGSRARHLTLILPPGSNIPISTLKKRKFRTLMVLGSKIADTVHNHFLHLRYLRTLNLSGCLITELPENIGKLIHLRYLNLSYNPKLIGLPSTVGNLFNLQTLRLVSCRSIRELPCTIRKLVNLRHLYIHGRFLLEFLPKGIGKLSSLRTICEFTVPAPVISNDRTCQLGDLKSLNNLRRLHINKLANSKDVEEANRAGLKDKKDLIDLVLTFRRNADSKVQEDVLEALHPHPDLQYLGISFFGGGTTISPSWLMSLTGLRRLVLRSCNSCETLPSLGKLPSLESLEVSRFERLNKVGPELLGIESDASHARLSVALFPRLKELSFRYAPISEWGGVPGWKVGSPLKIMPRLHSLKLDNCVLLETLPNFLQETPVQNLIIEDCPRLQKYSQKILDKEWTNICHIPNIKFLSRFYDDH